MRVVSVLIPILGWRETNTKAPGNIISQLETNPLRWYVLRVAQNQKARGSPLFPGEHPCSIALAVPPGAWLWNRELQELAQVWNAASLCQLAQVRRFARSDVARLTRPGLAPVRLARSSSLVEGGRALLPARSARCSRFRQKSA